MAKKTLTKRSADYKAFNAVQAFWGCKCSCSCSCNSRWLKNGNKRNSKDVGDLAGRR